jgi:photosystem II stability/assembly factor-like uncharacterized protein
VAGLEGADLRQLALDPRHPRIVFAASEYAGVFKSSDGGRSWRSLSIAPSVPQVCCLLVDPQHPRTVYAATLEGVFKSTDGGASWRLTGLTRSSVTALAFDPRDPETLFAGTTEGLFRSTDGGASWGARETRVGFVRMLAFDLTDPRRSTRPDPTEILTTVVRGLAGSPASSPAATVAVVGMPPDFSTAM